MKESRKNFSYIDPDILAVEAIVGRGQDLFEILEEDLGELHPEYSRAIRLHFGLTDDGKPRSYREVALEMHFSPTTARRRVEAGRRAFFERDPALFDKYPFVKSIGR